jgi:very-short-patch-repair endonuclease
MTRKLSKRSTLEQGFAFLLARLTTAPEPVREFRFHATRLWRFDFAWPESRVAVEIEGGIWVAGAHGRGKHFSGDCEKYNAATIDGWRVLRYTTRDLEKRPVQVVQEVASFLASQPSRIKAVRQLSLEDPRAESEN